MIRDGGGLVVLYEHDGQPSARVLWPRRWIKSKGGALSIQAWDSLRQEWRSFRLDRILTCHPLRGPPLALRGSAAPRLRAPRSCNIVSCTSNVVISR